MRPETNYGTNTGLAVNTNVIHNITPKMVKLYKKFAGHVRVTIIANLSSGVQS